MKNPLLAREGRNRYTDYMNHKRRLVSQIVFYTGLVLMLAGAVFLAGALSGVSRFSRLWSCLFLIIGGLFTIVSVKISGRPVYLFLAIFFLLTGIFFFLLGLNVLPVGLSQSWPLFVVFSGLALVPAGARRYRAIRISYLVPALAFIVFGLVLIPFSFKLVTFSFKRFMIDWWPLLALFVGGVLVLFSFGAGNNAE
jgi:hypothetical protein